MLPIYSIRIDSEETGIDRISLVENPGVDSNFLAFNNNVKQVMFSAKEEQQIIVGCLMRADYLIYRNDENGEYYIKFEKDTIKLMAEKLLLDNHQNYINIEHIDNSDVDGINMVQLFIKNDADGISPKGFEQIEDGSLFAVFKVRNQKIWEHIKNGTFKGFSIEGLFDFKDIDKENDEKTLDDILAMLDKIIDSK